MKNPFEEFQPAAYKRSIHRAEAYHQKNETVIRSWLDGYRAMLANEMSNLFWQTDHEHLAAVYHDIVAHVRGLEYSGHEIEAFCARLDQAAAVPLHIPGPMGLFISALVNLCRDAEIVFDTGGVNQAIHFLGYRLPRGKKLILKGKTGDFTGAGLMGGTLVVHGSTGNWCGSGMMDGRISVAENAGLQVGQWMHDGCIQIGGHVQSLGDQRYGGRVECNDDACDPV